MAETTETPKKRRKLFGGVFNVLGILMGTASLISLVQRWTGIEIVIEIAADAVSLYRQMMEQVKWVLFDWWAPIELPWGWVFEMPMWGMDVLAMWVLMAAGSIRALHARRNLKIQWEDALSANNPDASWHKYKERIIPVPLKTYAYLVIAAPYHFFRAIFIGFRVSIRLDTSEGGRVSTIGTKGWDWSPVATWYYLSIVTVTTGPLLLSVFFFLWNAIQITPQ